MHVYFSLHSSGTRRVPGDDGKRCFLLGDGGGVSSTQSCREQVKDSSTLHPRRHRTHALVSGEEEPRFVGSAWKMAPVPSSSVPLAAPRHMTTPSCKGGWETVCPCVGVGDGGRGTKQIRGNGSSSWHPLLHTFIFSRPDAASFGGVLTQRSGGLTVGKGQVQYAAASILLQQTTSLKNYSAPQRNVTSAISQPGVQTPALPFGVV
ncbi:uncharacterized protein LOC131496574 [Neofelis nebulosa]|uniref:uncharacterized protein LOC131496574 n=1 Tax=Neofelis nebulosa TaxID=61452 RepID=UPI00272B9206|nr:uncharacterized protein LOC131496574 [Neofelis nebulosa]